MLYDQQYNTCASACKSGENKLFGVWRATRATLSVMPKFASWQQGTAARKVVRQVRASDAHGTRNIPNGRKTRRFCRGKEGLEHKPAVTTYGATKMARWGVASFDRWLLQYCTVCGKELASYSPPAAAPGRVVPPPPEWVLPYLALHPEARATG